MGDPFTCIAPIHQTVGKSPGMVSFYTLIYILETLSWQPSAWVSILTLTVCCWIVQSWKRTTTVLLLMDIWTVPPALQALLSSLTRSYKLEHNDNNFRTDWQIHSNFVPVLQSHSFRAYQLDTFAGKAALLHYYCLSLSKPGRTVSLHRQCCDGLATLCCYAAVPEMLDML